MSDTTNGQNTPAQDFCSFVPDAPFGYDFSSICAVHDDNYGPSSTVSRYEADTIFREALHEACRAQYGDAWLCHASAEVYYIGVRLFGGWFYEGAFG